MLIALVVASGTSVLFSNKSEAAVCTPYMINSSSVADYNSTVSCTRIKSVDTFSGSASSKIEQIKNDITAAGEKVRAQMQANAEAEMTTDANNTEQTIKTIVETAQNQVNDTLERERLFLNMKMNYLAELKDREIKASKAPISMDDTAEEVEFLNEALEQAKKGAGDDTTSVDKVAEQIKANYPDGATIPVKIKAGKGSGTTATGEKCPDYDPKTTQVDDACFYGHKSFPAEKLQKYQDECSRAKRNVVRAANSANVAKAMSSEIKKSESQALNITNTSQKVVAKVTEQRKVNCNVEEFDLELCKVNEKGAYLQKVAENEIIPNGNVSAGNVFTPATIGTVDGNTSNMTDEELKKVNLAQLDKGTEAVTDNTPPIVFTYRTSNQYIAATDFVSNVVNREQIANQNIQDRRKSSSAVFQSKFLSRAAALSLAQNSLMKPIEVRVGKNLADRLKTGEPLDPNNMLKESVSGAGWLDEISHTINQDYEKLVVDKTGDGNATSETLANMSAEGFKEMELKNLIQQNMLLLNEYSQDERKELLLSALLAQKANSRENIEYLEKLRNQ